MREDLRTGFHTTDFVHVTPELTKSMAMKYQIQANFLSLFERLPDVIKTMEAGIDAHEAQKQRFVGSQEGGAI